MLQLLSAHTHPHTHANAVEEATVVLEEMDQVLVDSGEIQSKAEMTGYSHPTLSTLAVNQCHSVISPYIAH